MAGGQSWNLMALLFRSELAMLQAVNLLNSLVVGSVPMQAPGQLVATLKLAVAMVWSAQVATLGFWAAEELLRLQAATCQSLQVRR